MTERHFDIRANRERLDAWLTSADPFEDPDEPEAEVSTACACPLPLGSGSAGWHEPGWHHAIGCPMRPPGTYAAPNLGKSLQRRFTSCTIRPMTTQHTFHPDFVNLTNDDLAAIAADEAITLSVRGYAHADLVERLRLAYGAAVDFKYDETVEGTPDWRSADRQCDIALFALVTAMQASEAFTASRLDAILADYYGAP